MTSKQFLRQQRLQKQGRCTVCGRINHGPSKWRCPKCAKQNALSQRTRKEALK